MVLNNGMTATTTNGQNIITVASPNTEININESATITSMIIIGSLANNTTINFSAFATTTATSTNVTLGALIQIQAMTSLGRIDVNIPAGTIITSASSSGWTGIINTPIVKNNDSVIVAHESGKTASVTSVVEVGADDVKLIFDKAARILITGQAGKNAGYSRSGNFYAITNICSADTQEAGNALSAEGDCKIDVGSDLVIWTKHFTKFATYTQTTIPVSSGGSGGGGGSQTTSCNQVTYDDWSTICASGLQYRNIKSQSPTGCTLTTEQENNRKKQCNIIPLTASTTPIILIATSTIDTSFVKPVELITVNKGVQQWQDILANATIIASGKIENILAAVGQKRNNKTEDSVKVKYANKLISGLKNVAVETKTSIINFIAYGTPLTKKLGAGERAGVVNSYKAAFGKVPSTEAEWKDVIAISNGRWPNVRNKQAEDRAKIVFKKIYLRNPNKTNTNDNTAVVIMAYGLRPVDRNLNSEKTAIKIFKRIFKYSPILATDWDIIRAIGYSGAKR
ncbi:MAG: hypothetical protein Q7T79_03755 [bacterium]|nr:hypothetical protein [bacterium]